ncbi:hypothetical protein [Achromobacter sp. SLBN-14]|uniref:hypothetical protein n=1 Tax=Achromobacter sp. SLBN-14 TaxID=2768442 RepID=UPI001154C98C|nr:hypothetical protein [Achromobacter sp. SLBN-14]TQJ94681.1 hypothetical protein FBY20_1417 [Achromobacter sp. SLBN-14]
MANTVQIANDAKPVAVFLRGLEARVEWAKAGREGDTLSALLNAEGDGYHDFQAGRAGNDVPPLLADVPELAAAWSKGWDHAYFWTLPEFF